MTVIRASLLKDYAEVPAQAPHQRKRYTCHQLHRCRAVPSQQQAGADLRFSAAIQKEACSSWPCEGRAAKTTRSVRPEETKCSIGWLLAPQRVMEQARGWAGCSGGSGDSGCSRAFVAAMSGLRVPPGSQPTLAALQDDSDASDPRLVDCLLFLKNSEEVPRPRHSLPAPPVETPDKVVPRPDCCHLHPAVVHI